MKKVPLQKVTFAKNGFSLIRIKGIMGNGYPGIIPRINWSTADFLFFFSNVTETRKRWHTRLARTRGPRKSRCRGYRRTFFLAVFFKVNWDLGKSTGRHLTARGGTENQIVGAFRVENSKTRWKPTKLFQMYPKIRGSRRAGAKTRYWKNVCAIFVWKSGKPAQKKIIRNWPGYAFGQTGILFRGLIRVIRISGSKFANVSRKLAEMFYSCTLRRLQDPTNTPLYRTKDAFKRLQSLGGHSGHLHVEWTQCRHFFQRLDAL